MANNFCCATDLAGTPFLQIGEGFFGEVRIGRFFENRNKAIAAIAD